MGGVLFTALMITLTIGVIGIIIICSIVDDAMESSLAKARAYLEDRLNGKDGGK